MDINLLVEKVTKEVMAALKNITSKKSITVVSDTCEKNLIENFKSNLSAEYEMVKDIEKADYILLSKEKYNALMGNSVEIKGALNVQEIKAIPKNNAIDFSDKKVIQERDLKMLNLDEYDQILIGNKAIITALAMDLIKNNNLKIIK